MSELTRYLIEIRVSVWWHLRIQEEQLSPLNQSTSGQQNDEQSAALAISPVRRRSSNEQRKRTIAVNVHPFIVAIISRTIEMLQSVLYHFIEFFVAAHISSDIVHQLSILLTSIHLLQPHVSFSNATTIQYQIIWMLPVFTSIASFSFFLALLVHWHPNQVVIASGLVSILILECLVPLAITSCTALFLIQFWTWESAIIILMLVWVASIISSRCIRCVLYPNLGQR